MIYTSTRVIQHTPIRPFNIYYQLVDIFRCSDFLCFLILLLCEFLACTVDCFRARATDRMRGLVLFLWYKSIAAVESTVLPACERNICFSDGIIFIISKLLMSPALTQVVSAAISCKSLMASAIILPDYLADAVSNTDA